MEFDKINDNIIGIFKESLDLFIIYKRQLELYEERLTDCKINNKTKIYKMNVPSISEIKTPNLGNNIIQITGSEGYKKETLENFTEFFNGDACPLLSHSKESLPFCRSFWNSILTKGMEQTIAKIGSHIENIIEELNSINEKGKEFNEIIKNSNFQTFEIFVGFYYQRAYLIVDEMFRDLLSEKTQSIINIFKISLIVYIIICNFLALFLIYFVLNSKFIFNYFLNFIWILPVKYLAEDENFYKEVIKFGEISY